MSFYFYQYIAIYATYLKETFYLGKTFIKRKKETTNIMDICLILFFTLVVAINAQHASFSDCKTGPLSTLPICNQSLRSRQRAADLISRITISLIHKNIIFT
jgi:hypothetical protein